MPCTPFPLPDGHVALVCGPRARRRRCSVCGALPAHVVLCDGPGVRPGKRCDAPLCRQCAVHPDPEQDKDYCPRHVPTMAPTG